jgi:ubiquinone/menaquinone biosynthesis C-methylase UbiE
MGRSDRRQRRRRECPLWHANCRKPPFSFRPAIVDGACQSCAWLILAYAPKDNVREFWEYRPVSDMNRSFSGSMPEFYDRFLVPFQFEQFASDLVERVRTMTEGKLLEIAAGTGVVTRALARSLPASVEITTTDLNPAMLAWARSYPGLDRITWQEADAMALPFADNEFDQVMCQFGVMFFPDKLAGFREAFRVLRPSGEFRFNVWGDMTGTVMQLAREVIGASISRDPASMGAPQYNDISAICAVLSAAGFASITAEKLSKCSSSSSAREAAIATCHGGLLRAAIDNFAADRLDKLTDDVESAIVARFGNGRINAPLHAILFTGTKPPG